MEFVLDFCSEKLSESLCTELNEEMLLSSFVLVIRCLFGLRKLSNVAD